MAQFRSVIDNPKIQALMLKIEDNITEHNPGERLYRCWHCRDKAVTLEQRKSRLGDDAYHANGCRHCTPGAHVLRGQAAEMLRRRKAGEVDLGRQLTDDEREQAAVGEFGFLDGE
jgi:hypothetical protein